MKKKYILMVAIIANSISFAGDFSWSSVNLWGNLDGVTAVDGWLAAIYQDVDEDNTSGTWYNTLSVNSLGSVVSSDSITADDTLLSIYTTLNVPFSGVASLNSIDTNATDNINVYTLLFNATSIASATQFIVLDSTSFDIGAVSSPSTPTDYVAPAPLGSWQQVVPEPATFLLFGMGAMGAWLVRRKQRII